MAIVAEKTGTRLILADQDKKTVCSFSRINPDVTAFGISGFADAISDLMDRDISFNYLENTYELTETA